MSCCICISTIKYNSNIIQCQQCLQIYHQNCYMKWYKYNNNINQCPHCNYKSNNEIIITHYIPDVNVNENENENELYNSFSNLDCTSSFSIDNDEDNQSIPIIEEDNPEDNPEVNINLIDTLYPNRNNDIACCIVTILFFIFGAIFLLYFNSLEKDDRKNH